MKNVTQIAYRYLTNAEFFNINKPAGTETGGGGQAYIDFPTTDISVAGWNAFFEGVQGVTKQARAQGPSWNVPIYSIGTSGSENPQSVTIYQRRANSVCVGSQKITSQSGNRVRAWHPAYGFPEPEDPTDRQQLPGGLVVYLVRTSDEQVWAGWFRNAPGSVQPSRTPDSVKLLHSMLSAHDEGDAELRDFGGSALLLDESDSDLPFTTGTKVSAGVAKSNSKPQPKPGPDPAAQGPAKPAGGLNKIVTIIRTEAEILNDLFDEDSTAGLPPAEIEKVIKIRVRNQKAVKAIKELYGNTCQMSGLKLTFKKKDGNHYTEAHHLVPLGQGGADDPRNIIVVSPLIHKMLHYASVSTIDLKEIKKLEDGTSYLDILINDEPYRIRWHKEHAKKVAEVAEKPVI